MLYGDADYASVEYASIWDVSVEYDGQSSDVEPILEEIAKAIGVGREESESISDYLQKVMGFISQLSDSVSVADSHAKAIGQSHQDLGAIEEQIVKILGKVFLDTQVLADQIVVSAGVPKSDALAIADSIQAQVGRMLADDESISDFVLFGIGKGGSDSELITTTVAKMVAKVLNDAEALADQVAKAIGKPVADAIGIADILSSTLGRNLSDAIAVSDQRSLNIDMYDPENEQIVANMAKDVGKAIIDSGLLSETMVKAFSMHKEENLGITDNLIAQILNEQYELGLDEAMILAEVLKGVIGKVLLDDEQILDQISLGAGKSLDEQEEMIDNLTKYIRIAINDTQAIADGISKVIGISMSDSLVVADIFSVQLNKIFSDAVSVSDLSVIGVKKGFEEGETIVINIAKKVGKVINESFSISDQLITVFKSLYDIDDTEPISDLLVKSIGFGDTEQQFIITNLSKSIGKVINDSANISDTLQSLVVYIRSLSDIASVAEQISMLARLHKEENEAIIEVRSDLVGKNMVEAITVVDSISLLLSWSKSFTETLNLNEVRQMFLAKVMSDDSEEISEQRSAGVGKILGEILTIGDVLTSVFIVVVGFGTLTRVDVKELRRAALPAIKRMEIKKLNRDNPKVLN